MVKGSLAATFHQPRTRYDGAIRAPWQFTLAISALRKLDAWDALLWKGTHDPLTEKFTLVVVKFA